MDRDHAARQSRDMDIEHGEVLKRLIRSDPLVMAALKAVCELGLQDAWITAGFIRNRVWDHLHGYETPTPLNDVDVIYFDPNRLDPAFEKQLEQTLSAGLPGLPFEVRNQVRMADRNGDAPYRSINDALEHWCETPTAIGARLDPADQILLIAPLGLSDLFEMIARPTPFALAHPHKLSQYRDRMIKKDWPRLWPRVKVLNL